MGGGLNASGKAKLFNRRDTSLLAGIHYHKDDRQNAIDGLKEFVPVGSTILAVDHGKGRYDFYLLYQDAPGKIEKRYISKFVGSIFDYTIWDGAPRNGIDCGYFDPVMIVQELGVILYEDRAALHYLEVRN